MGGVDLLDCTLSELIPVIQGKKWYWPLIINTLDIASVYSWQVFRIVSEEPVTPKSYRRQIVGILIRGAHREIISVHSRPAKCFRIPDEICFERVKHYAICCPVRRCVLCGKNGKKACDKCKLTLHLDTCFQMFHER